MGRPRATLSSAIGLGVLIVSLAAAAGHAPVNAANSQLVSETLAWYEAIEPYIPGGVRVGLIQSTPAFGGAILSPRSYNSKARMAIACPVTSQVKGYPFEVSLPAGGRISGVVLADHVKNLDWPARQVTFESKAPAEVVTDVRERLRVLLGL